MNKEQEFLHQYRIEDYERPSVTTDVTAFTIRRGDYDSYRHDPKRELSVLLVKRGSYPFKDMWALPGGFLKPGETVEECAVREIKEETNVEPQRLLPVGVFSEPGRDPRGWIISNAYAAVIGEEAIEAKGGDDAAEARWFVLTVTQTEEKIRLEITSDDISLSAVLREDRDRFGIPGYSAVENNGLAFDHACILCAAVMAMRRKAEKFEAVFDFLPEKFTLAALQKVQETIMGVSLLPANFRRKVSDYVEETEEFTSGAGHRPAKLYIRKKER